MTEQTLRRDSGVAMIMVLGMISVMTLIVAGSSTSRRRRALTTIWRSSIVRMPMPSALIATMRHCKDLRLRPTLAVGTMRRRQAG